LFTDSIGRLLYWKSYFIGKKINGRVISFNFFLEIFYITILNVCQNSLK
jgi:hypothetical protein